MPPWLWALVLLVVDFVTKRLVLANAAVLADRVEILGDLLRLVYVRNPGAAMGLALGGRPFLIAVSVLAVVFLAVLYRRTDPRLGVRRTAIACIAAGAAGNLVDRVFYEGLVVDFIDIGLGSHRFWAFNVADMGVTLGGAVLFICLWREGRVEAAAPADPSAAELPDD